MRLNLGQVQRVRLCPLKTVTGHHTQTVLGRVGVVRAAGVDNRCRGHCMLVALAQWKNVGLWPAVFPCPAPDLQPTGDHSRG